MNQAVLDDDEEELYEYFPLSLDDWSVQSLPFPFPAPVLFDFLLPLDLPI